MPNQIEAARKSSLHHRQGLWQFKITDNPESVWTSEWNELSLVPAEDQEHMDSLLVQHLRRLVKERDELSQKVIQFALQNLCYTSGTSTLSPTSSTSIDKSHLIVELADVKARLRKLQQEVEEKNEGITELKEELEKSKESQCKLRQENLELIQDARTAKTYRDEIDILKERVHKVDRLESEIQRYKDKMNELDFYKSRVEELREDNRILVETKSMLEEQLEASRKRAEQVVELEAEILKYCSQINELNIERDSDKEKIQQLLEENAQLHIERKASMEELVQLQSELSQAFTPSPLENHSLMEQLNTETQTRVLQLELENKRLHMLVESLNRSPSFEISDPIGNLRKEHKALKEKNNHLEKEIAELKVEAKKFTSLELQCADFEKLVGELKQALKVQQADVSKCEKLEQSLNSLTTENQKLQKMVDSSQQRIKDLQQDLQAVENENQKLNNTKSSVEEENCSLNNQVSSLRDQNNNLKSQLESVEQHLASVVSHNNTLQSKLAKLEVEITVVSSQNKTLNHQKSQFQSQVSNLEDQLKKENLQHIEMENRNRSLATDHESLQRLHEQLTNDYDSLIKVHSSLKAHHKSLKSEYNDLKEKMQSVLMSHEEVMRLRQVLEDDDSRVDSRLLNTLRADHIQLKEQLKSLRDAHEGVTKELKSLQIIHKSLKTENNELKLKHTALQGELLECQNETSSLDVEVSKLTNCCELLTQKNSMMEEEQQSLMSHLSMLLGQYHELLYQVISEQNQYRKEENSFREKLRELCQQKEKLEQRILDHSSKLQKSPKRKPGSGGSMRMRRTRSAFLRNSKHDALSSQSDNSTDSSLYCSLRRPNKPLGWSFKNKGNILNPEDSCQEDHIPVRDVGLAVQKDGCVEQNVIPSEKRDDASSEFMKDMGSKHTTLENNMTLNFITNLTNADVLNCSPSQPFSRSASSQQISSYNLGRHCTSDNSFQPLSYIANDVLHCPQVANKPTRPLSAYCSDTNSNIDTIEASKFSRTKPEKSDPNGSRGSSKEKSLENSVWYEYGCV
ncbi:Protein Daple [Araneus ventricosus]|uniref:Protein Daple n=1 Tax=Araneus ventricosus TaxID=182803 RepID=A0A4Y2HZP3_ARAVE|nr:Protein Daple [Araneus ventricosus]